MSFYNRGGPLTAGTAVSCIKVKLKPAAMAERRGLMRGAPVLSFKSVLIQLHLNGITRTTQQLLSDNGTLLLTVFVLFLFLWPCCYYSVFLKPNSPKQELHNASN